MRLTSRSIASSGVVLFFPSHRFASNVSDPLVHLRVLRNLSSYGRSIQKGQKQVWVQLPMFRQPGDSVDEPLIEPRSL